MRTLSFSILCLVAIICAAYAHARPADDSIRLLFVGNSVIYVGNLPAVVDALARSNKKSVQSDMIVKGGATLSERVADGSVERALAEKKYDYVVLQERGGDVLCDFSLASCKDVDAALNALAHAALKHGAKPVLLGTYQFLPQVSKNLVEAEAAAASRLSIPYISVSERLQMARASAPEAAWLYQDGGHPGHDLVLLEAALIYRNLFGALPDGQALVVNAPMYKPSAKFSAPSPVSNALPSSSDSPAYTYSASSVATVLQIAGRISP